MHFILLVHIAVYPRPKISKKRFRQQKASPLYSIYDQVLRIDHNERLIVSYPCTYKTKPGRITSVDPEGRQQYHHFQAIQLALFTLAIARSVWRMPRYRWLRWPRRVVRSLQTGLF